MTEASFAKVSSFKGWCLAARPKTLTASIVPIGVSFALSQFLVGKASLLIAGSALLFALAIQIGTNLVNDALDFEKGADNERRIGPLRVTQQQIFQPGQVLKAAFLFFAAAAIFSVPLVMEGGLAVALVVLLSIACGYLYTGGPYPFAYVGLGELFVMLFFGFVSVVATTALLTSTLPIAAFLAGGQVGSLSTVLIAINNMRDIKEDALANKRTLAVRFGLFFARLEIAFFVLLPYAIGFFWISLGAMMAALLPLLLIPFAALIVRAIWKEEPSELFNQFLAFSALQQLVFAVLLILGLLYHS